MGEEGTAREETERRLADIIKQEKNSGEERSQQLEIEVEKSQKLENQLLQQEEVSRAKLEEKTQQVSILELEVKEISRQLKESNTKCEELAVAHEALNIMLRNKEKEIYHLTNKLLKRKSK